MRYNDSKMKKIKKQLKKNEYKNQCNHIWSDIQEKRYSYSASSNFTYIMIYQQCKICNLIKVIHAA